jgi:hypothetical protein
VTGLVVAGAVVEGVVVGDVVEGVVGVVVGDGLVVDEARVDFTVSLDPPSI